jgi:citronellol/citronellal dehydrogenase
MTFSALEKPFPGRSRDGGPKESMMSANHRCDGKVALVTGSSRGLGKAIAARLAAQGATVALAARTMEPDPKYHGSLGQTLDEIVAAGGRAIAVQADLSQAEERERLFAEVVNTVGAPDILVNNAAVTFLRPLDEFPERRVRLMMEMHVLGPLHLSQLAIPAMRDRGRGWILNLTSVGGDLPPGPPFSEFDRTAGFGIYGTVKAALNRLTKSLAAELYDDGIAVNAAAPSNPVATPGAGTLDLAKTDTEDIELITETVLRLCTGDPKTMTGRVAHTQTFLAEVAWSKPVG